MDNHAATCRKARHVSPIDAETQKVVVWAEHLAEHLAEPTQTVQQRMDRSDSSESESEPELELVDDDEWVEPLAERQPVTEMSPASPAATIPDKLRSWAKKHCVQSSNLPSEDKTRGKQAAEKLEHPGYPGSTKLEHEKGKKRPYEEAVVHGREGTIQFKSLSCGAHSVNVCKFAPA